MSLIEQFRQMVGAYYGVLEMDEYPTNIFETKKIENFIRQFVKDNPIDDYDLYEEAKKIEYIPLKMRLQDSLVILNRINGPMDLNLLIKKKIRELDKDT